jgi:hypothetical protein
LAEKMQEPMKIKHFPSRTSSNFCGRGRLGALNGLSAVPLKQFMALRHDFSVISLLFFMSDVSESQIS